MAENLDIRENEMQQGTAAYLRGVDASGNSILAPASKFINTTTDFTYNYLIKIAEVIEWQRFAALCVIGSTDGISQMILSISGTFVSNKPRLVARYIGDKISSIKVLYKVDVGTKISVYLYNKNIPGNTVPFVINSSQLITSSQVTDISEYSEITISKMNV